MTTHLDLPEVLIDHLRDESRLLRCRAALNEELTALAGKRQQARLDRPLFGLFSTSEARAKFTRDAAAFDERARKVHSQLEQFAKLAPWLHASLEKALMRHLRVVPGEYRDCLQACETVDQWARLVGGLVDKAKGFARDARAVAAQIAEASRSGGRSSLPRGQLLGDLRTTAEWTKRDLDAVASARLRFAKLIDPDGDPVIRLSMPEGFRTPDWVNRLALMSDLEVFDEVVRCETDARAFISLGGKRLLTNALEIRAICERAGRQILQNNLRELLVDLGKHYRLETDTDRVIEEITEKHVAARLREHQSTFESTPLLIGR